MGGCGMFRYDVVWSGMTRMVRTNFWDTSSERRKKMVEDFPAHAPQPMMEGVPSGNGEGWKLRSKLIHGRYLNASAKKALGLEMLESFEVLESC